MWFIFFESIDIYKKIFIYSVFIWYALIVMKDILIALVLLLWIIALRGCCGQGSSGFYSYQNLQVEDLESKVVTYDVFPEVDL